MAYTVGQTFGRGVNDINPLFSNNESTAQVHTGGFVKRFNPSLDATEGRVAFFEAGERMESININHSYGQVVRNAALWVANLDGDGIVTTDPEITVAHDLKLYPNPAQDHVSILGKSLDNSPLHIYNSIGKEVTASVNIVSRSSTTIALNTSDLSPGHYLVKVSGAVISMIVY